MNCCYYLIEWTDRCACRCIWLQGATSWRPRWTRHRVPRSYL